jgi:hypothetical protein
MTLPPFPFPIGVGGVEVHPLKWQAMVCRELNGAYLHTSTNIGKGEGTEWRAA